MADWQRRLNMADIWEGNDIPKIARIAADRLEALEPFPAFPGIDEEKAELVEELRSLAEDPDIDANDFDEVWRRVYDWGDTKLDAHWNGKKVCWIATF